MNKEKSIIVLYSVAMDIETIVSALNTVGLSRFSLHLRDLVRITVAPRFFECDQTKLWWILGRGRLAQDRKLGWRTADKAGVIRAFLAGRPPGRAIEACNSPLKSRGEKC